MTTGGCFSESDNTVQADQCIGTGVFFRRCWHILTTHGCPNSPDSRFFDSKSATFVIRGLRREPAGLPGAHVAGEAVALSYNVISLHRLGSRLVCYGGKT